MRSADEQLRLIRNKAAGLRRRRQALLWEGGCAVCLLAAVFLRFLLPGVGAGAALPEGAAYGSLILTSPMVSCIVVAVLAFALGICVTLLCVHRREQGGEGEDEDP